MIDDQEILMNISDGTSIVSHFDINWDTGEFIYIARNDGENGNGLQLINDIDTQKLLSNMKDTTKTLYQEGRFVEISLEEILEIQNKNTIDIKKLKCIIPLIKEVKTHIAVAKAFTLSNR